MVIGIRKGKHLVNNRYSHKPHGFRGDPCIARIIFIENFIGITIIWDKEDRKWKRVLPEPAPVFEIARV